MIKVDLVAAMGCSKCGKPGVIFQEYSGLHLCPQHFREDLLHKAKKTVRQNHWLVPGTRYAVALSGGQKSCALLYFMHILAGERKDIRLVAVTINDSDPEARENAKALSESFGIRWFEIPGDKVTIQQENRFDAPNLSPFMARSSTECQLKLMAEELQFDALVMGYTLEDHAEWVLWNAISGKTIQETGSPAETRRRVQVTRPFMHIPGKELELYTRLFLENYNVETQPETGIHVVDPINTIMARFYSRHPGIPYALVNIGEQVKKFRDQCS